MREKGARKGTQKGRAVVAKTARRDKGGSDPPWPQKLK